MHILTKPFLGGLLIACLALPVAAQSPTVSIPATASVVSASQTPRANNGTWWVCGAGRLNLTGNNNTVIGEPGAVLVVSGNNNTVYSRSTVMLTVTGNNNTIYNGAGARVVINGNNNVVHAPTRADVSLTGNNNTRHGLSSLAYSYASSPGTGCRPLAVSEDVAAADELSLSPNPVETNGQLTITAKRSPAGARVYDVTGRAVRSWDVPVATLDLSGLPRGLYVVQVRLAEAMVARRVVIE